MRLTIVGLPTLLAAALLLGNALSGCGRASTGPSLAAIPVYPNCTATTSMAGSAPGGLMGANLRQYTTGDSFDVVVDFYTESLAPMEPQVESYATDQGRQTAFSVRRRKGVVTVAVQEFPEERAVHITLMGAGR